MFLAYAWGVRFCHAEKEDPMWRPRLTRETVQDLPDESSKDRKTKGLLWVQFFILVILLAFSGYLLEKSGVALAKAWGIRTVILGTFLTAVITSLPELVITFAAVKRGALTLAVGGIVGGNSFDVLFLGFSDLAYREGSIYHTLSSDQLSYLGLTILMNAVLLMGLIRREKSGPANIGTESLLIGILYIFGLFVLF
jgi:cation:H+ antiporter